MNKVCSKCKASKPLDQFGSCANAKDGKSWYCFECTNKYNRERRIKVTYRAVFEKYDNKCALCGSKDNLQVHHLNGKIKEQDGDLLLVCKDCHYNTMHQDNWGLKLHCKRCGHSWYPKQPEVRICPKCKSAYWDKDRQR